MSNEDVKDVDISEEEAAEVEETSAEEQEYTEVELEAMDKGWRPEGVEGKRNLSAEEFLDRRSLFDKISHLNRKIANYDKTIESLKQHNKQIAEMKYNDIIKDLKSKKREAMEAQDFEAADALDDKIDEVKEARRNSEKQEANSSNANPAFDAWLVDNPWYAQDQDLKDAADSIGAIYVNNHGNAPPEEVFEHVTKRIKELYPEKFGSTRKRRGSPVESGNNRGADPSKSRTSSKYSVKDLPDDARKIMEQLVNSKVLTKEEYLEQYFGKE